MPSVGLGGALLFSLLLRLVLFCLVSVLCRPVLSCLVLSCGLLCCVVSSGLVFSREGLPGVLERDGRLSPFFTCYVFVAVAMGWIDWSIQCFVFFYRGTD